MSRKKYHSLHGAPALLKYAESFGLRETDRKVYKALQSLESQQDGLCKDVVANHRTIARASNINLKTVGRVLERLQNKGLISYKSGSTTYADKRASRIRRYPLEELQRSEPARNLASVLSEREIKYGAKIVTPAYNAKTTNRVYSSKPNVQGNKSHRAELLAANCKADEILYDFDFKAAEPTVIAQELGYVEDGYTIIRDAEGMSRERVKAIFNRIVYSRTSAARTALAHGITTTKSLEFFERVDDLHLQLREENKRYVITKQGTRIDCPPGKRIHKGMLLAYLAQGTIADFINPASLRIIELEKEHGWKFIAPCHDGVYVVALPEHQQLLHDILISFVRNYDMTLTTKRHTKTT